MSLRSLRRQQTFRKTSASLAAPIFQSRTTGGVTTGTTMSITLPGSIATGNFILVAVGGSRSSTAPTTALSGYSKMVEIFQASGASGGFLSIWGKIAGSSESNPTFDVTSVNTNMSYICERWTGVGSFSTALTGIGYTNSGTFTMTSNPITTTVANSVVLTGIGGRTGATGDAAQVWGGGATGAYDTPSGRVGFIQDALQTLIATGSTTHTAQVTNNQGAPASCIGSVILSPV